MIHFYELASMSAAERTRLLRRAEMQIDEWSERARPILQEVRQRGDEALLESGGYRGWLSVHRLARVEKWTRPRWWPLTCVESMKYIVSAARRQWPRWPMEQAVFVACLRLQGLVVAL